MSVLAELRKRASWVYRHPTLRPLALSTHGWFLFNAVFTTVYVPYAYLELGIGATGLGVTFALAGVGALLGSSASEFLGRRVGIPGTIVDSRVLEAGGIAVIAAAASTEGTAVVVAAAAGQLMYGLDSAPKDRSSSLTLRPSHQIGCRAGRTPRCARSTAPPS